MLSVWNQRGGEANVSTGWHAIEFLLWGQDFDPTGPGSRPHTDYVVGAGDNAARRAEYLRLATDLLVEHLHRVSAAWAADPAPTERRSKRRIPIKACAGSWRGCWSSAVSS